MVAKPATKVVTKPVQTTEDKPETRAEPRYAIASAGSVAVRLVAPKAEPVAARVEAASAPPVATGSTEPIRPILVRTVTVRAGTQAASRALHPSSPAAAAPVRAIAAPAKPAPAPAKVEAPLKVEAPAQVEPVPAARPAVPAAAPTRVAEAAPSSAPALGFAPASAGAATSAAKFVPAALAAVSTQASAPAATPTPAVAVAAAPSPAPAAAPAALSVKPKVRSGWSIQVGAFPAEQDAHQRLSAVQNKAAKILVGNDPYTEPVLRGETTYYRARFAGFDQDRAEAACKYLKRNDVECILIRN